MARRRKSPAPPESRRSAQRFFAMEAAFSARLALFASLALFELSIVACAAFLSWMRRAAR
jgi:uncharacterized membrane protein